MCSERVLMMFWWNWLPFEHIMNTSWTCSEHVLNTSYVLHFLQCRSTLFIVIVLYFFLLKRCGVLLSVFSEQNNCIEILNITNRSESLSWFDRKVPLQMTGYHFWSFQKQIIASKLLSCYLFWPTYLHKGIKQDYIRVWGLVIIITLTLIGR